MIIIEIVYISIGGHMYAGIAQSCLHEPYKSQLVEAMDVLVDEQLWSWRLKTALVADGEIAWMLVKN